MKRVLGIVGVAMWLVSSMSAPAESADEEARQKLVGKWRGGLADERQPTMELIITPTKIVGKDLKNGERLGEGRYNVVPAQRILDTHGIANPVRGQTYLGVYSLKGDTLKWCSNNGGERRPTDLVHDPGRGQFLMILRRQK